MDIVSAISAIITLLGAGGTIVNGLEKLSSLREAPNSVLALNNEISDFRAVTLELFHLLRQESIKSSASQTHIQNLHLVLGRAREKILELECLIEYRLIAPNSGNDIRLNNVAWVLERYRVKRLQKEIRSMRISLVTILTILNCRSASRVELQLAGLRSLGEGLQSQLGQSLTRTANNMESVESQFARTRTQLDANSHLLAVISGFSPDGRRTLETQASSPARNELLRNCPNLTGCPVISISSIALQNHSASGSACTCQCHQRRTWKSPQWLGYLFGMLFTGYTGMPLLSPSCNQIRCRHRSEPTVVIQYYFPRWFVHRVLQLSLQLSTQNGLAQTIRIHRVVWRGSDLFRKTHLGDVEGVKSSLASRQGSPFDVTEAGLTALQVSNVKPCHWEQRTDRTVIFSWPLIAVT